MLQSTYHQFPGELEPEQEFDPQNSFELWFRLLRSEKAATTRKARRRCLGQSDTR